MNVISLDIGPNATCPCEFHCDSCRTPEGCEEHRIFMCASCGEATRWSDGGDDDRPNDCSDCWHAWFAPREQLAAGIASYLSGER